MKGISSLVVILLIGGLIAAGYFGTQLAVMEPVEDCVAAGYSEKIGSDSGGSAGFTCPTDAASDCCFEETCIDSSFLVPRGERWGRSCSRIFTVTAYVKPVVPICGDGVLTEADKNYGYVCEPSTSPAQYQTVSSSQKFDSVVCPGTVQQIRRCLSDCSGYGQWSDVPGTFEKTDKCCGITCAPININCNDYCSGLQHCTYATATASCAPVCSNGICGSCTPSCGTPTCKVETGYCGATCASNADCQQVTKECNAYCDANGNYCSYARNPVVCNPTCNNGACTGCEGNICGQPVCSRVIGECGVNECSEGQRKCSSNTAQTCQLVSGVWRYVDYEDCGTRTCQGGYCSECSLSESKCVGSVLYNCWMNPTSNRIEWKQTNCGEPGCAVISGVAQCREPLTCAKPSACMNSIPDYSAYKCVNVPLSGDQVGCSGTDPTNACKKLTCSNGVCTKMDIMVCESGYACVDGSCEPKCGDGLCIGESCSDCPSDCGACPVTFTPEIKSMYQQGVLLQVTVYTTELPQGQAIKGFVGAYQGSGTVDSQGKAVVSFGSQIPAGEYTAYFTTTKAGVPVYSDDYDIKIYESLAITMTTREAQPLYTGEGIVMLVTVLNKQGQQVFFGEQWSAYINKPENVIAISPSKSGGAAGEYEYTIPAEQFYEGTLWVTLKATADGYWPTEKSMSIRVERASVVLTLDFPTTAIVDDADTLIVYVTDQNGNPINPDRLDMTLTLPGTTVREIFDKSDFMGTTGEYSLVYIWKYGQNHRFEVSAWYGDYYSAKQSTTVAVSGGSVMGCTSDFDCPQGFRCVNEECVPEEQIPWLWIVVTFVLIGIIGLIWWKARK